MPRILTLFCFLVTCLTALRGSAQDQTRATPRPNLVIFLSDDHTWRDSSAYGSQEIDTPNMQRLAAAGMTFQNAYVASPSCAPSRAALLTGLYPARNGAEANHSRPRPDIKKLPAHLHDLGYEVVSFGKVGHYQQTPEYGFDLARHFNYHEDVAIPQALKWLGARESDKPLCLFVGTNWPHVPWPEAAGIDRDKLQVPPNHVATPVSREWRAKYVAAIGKMDSELGQVYDLARRKLGDDCFFLHTSDHGAQWPFGKWNLYDDGVRTPLIVSWPGRVAAGSRSEAMVSWIDILPTLVEVAGGPPPQRIDGRSFLPVLQGKSATHRELIFTTHSSDGNNNVYPMRSVRTPDGWKLIRNLHPEYRYTSHVTNAAADSGYWSSWLEAAVDSPEARSQVLRYLRRPAEELYHIADDPYERRNLIDEPANAVRAADLRQRLDDWMKQTGDPQTTFGKPKRIAPKGRPNVVTIFIDDMGWADLSCFGGKGTETENIDRLATEGIRFKNFYVNAPICSPSRVALTTGQYPHRWKITSFLEHRRSNEERGMAQWLDPQAPVLARELSQAGYATGHFGKWHMGGQRDVGDAPLITAYGFDRSLTNFEGLGPRVLPLCDAHDGQPPKKHDLGSESLGKGPVRWEDRSVVTTSFVKDALAFIEQAQAAEQPFFVNLWPDDVHSPFFPPQIARAAANGDKRAMYYAVLKSLDRQLKPLFDRLRDDDKLRGNTLVVLASDNGPEPGAGTTGPLRGVKGMLYEGGVRSPLIVWGPGLIAANAAGKIDDSSILCSLDLNRSLYALTDTPLPTDTSFDGENVIDTLLGKSPTGRQGPVFWRRPPDRPGPKDDPNPDLAVREGKWKAFVGFDGKSRQLYDLTTDIGESTNLAEKHPEVITRLSQAMLGWHAALPPDAGSAPPQKSSLSTTQFVNPIGEGADPWVVRDPNANRYLWCFSEGNRGISVQASDRLTSLGSKRVVWNAPADGPCSKEVWAPELHFLDGRWHIYFAASDGKNANHLAYVLRSNTADPLGEYQLHGPLATGDGPDGLSPNIWAIDVTVLEHQGKRYAVWSGWDAPGTDRQFLYIAPMKSPVELAGPRVRLCGNDDFEWERTQPGPKGRGLNEAPQAFKTDKRTMLMYSCGASWLPNYKLGRLTLVGNDPLDPASWNKLKQPAFEAGDDTYGVGHSCFVKSPDGAEWWHVFHAKQDRQPGWRRAIFVQPLRIGPQGFPQFGKPVAPGVPQARPSGETVANLKLPYERALTSEPDLLGWSYFGHHQFATLSAKGLHLGKKPTSPINDFRSGEKMILDATAPSDLTVEVTVHFLGDSQAGDAGILLRTSGAALGYDAQRGYFAGLVPKSGLVIFGKTDGTKWTEISRSETKIDVNASQRLRVEAKGDRFTVLLNGKTALTAQDASFATGSIGLRVVDTHAAFSNIRVE